MYNKRILHSIGVHFSIVSTGYINMNLLKLYPPLNRVSIKMFNYTHVITTKSLRYKSTELSTDKLTQKESGSQNKKEESIRMKQFHTKLKLQPIPRVPPKERFVDLVLVEVDPSSGELIANSEKDPTKWGDWQNGGRVTDF